MKFKLLKAGNLRLLSQRAINFFELGTYITPPNISYENVTIPHRNQRREATGVKVRLQLPIVLICLSRK